MLKPAFYKGHRKRLLKIRKIESVLGSLGPGAD
jgi:hypothetical protein